MQYTIESTVLDGWKIVRLIGEGGYGKVFEIEKKIDSYGLTTRSALKVIQIPQSQADIRSALSEGMDERTVTSQFRSYVDEIVHEIAVMSTLKSHPNIVSYEDHLIHEYPGEIRWDILIRMELLTPLIEYQLRHTLSTDEILRMGREICDALVFCQRKGLLHRDIKPENIFVSETGQFKLGDFGVSRMVEKTTGGMSKKGTESYMAPEVYLGQPYGSTVDIYSLGLVLYRLCNDGRLPFLPPAPHPISFGDRENAMIRRMRGEPFPPPANADENLTAIILKACAYKSEDRYKNATELLQDLDRCAKGFSEPENARDYNSVQTHPEPPAQEGCEDGKTIGAWGHEKHTGNDDAYIPSESPKKDDGDEVTSGAWSAQGKRVDNDSFHTSSGHKPLDDDEQFKEFIKNSSVNDESSSASLGRDTQQKSGTQPKPNQQKSTHGLPKPTIIAAAAAIVVLVLIVVFSAGKVSGTCGGSAKWTLRNGVLTISGNGPMDDYTDDNPAPWDAHGIEITSVIIKDGITTIGDYAFNGIVWIKDVTIPDSVTSIGAYSFFGCGIAEITIPNSVISVGRAAFAYCLNLSSVTIPDSIAPLDDTVFSGDHDVTVYVYGGNQAQSNAEAFDASDTPEPEVELPEENDIPFVVTDTQEPTTEMLSLPIRESSTIFAGFYHTVGLRSDGTVVAVGSNWNGECNVEQWQDIVAVAAGFGHTIGLKSDGTVVAVGKNDNSQCDVSGWTDIVAVSTGYYHTIGLKSDGTVVAVGSNANNQCDVERWTDIVAISTETSHTVGLKSDGTVVAVGNNFRGECDVEDWTNIVAISAGRNCTIGLKSDGTVVAVGYKSFGQCDVSDWTDIVAISAGDSHTVGLKSDGTVVAVGKSYGYAGECDVEDWTDIVAISAGDGYTVGLKSDGTVVAVGNNTDGKCDVSDWTNIRMPA